MEIGYNVLTPYGDCERYDFVVDVNNKFYRIQVKTAKVEKDNRRVQTQKDDDFKKILSPKTQKSLAILIPLLFALDVVVMMVAKLQGGDATALIGGTALFILIIVYLELIPTQRL